MPLTSFGADQVAIHVVFSVGMMSLHTAYPSELSLFEVEGGDYARQPIRLTFFSSGVVANDPATETVFDVPPNTSVAYMGLWDSQGSNPLGYIPLRGSLSLFPITCNDLLGGVFSTAGGLGIRGADLNQQFYALLHHATVVLWGLPQYSPDFVKGGLYYVVNEDVTTRTFQLSSISNGPPIIPTQPTIALMQTCEPSPLYSIDSVLVILPLLAQILIDVKLGGF